VVKYTYLTLVRGDATGIRGTMSETETNLAALIFKQNAVCVDDMHMAAQYYLAAAFGEQIEILYPEHNVLEKKTSENHICYHCSRLYFVARM
jgi:hypothetical protein